VLIIIGIIILIAIQYNIAKVFQQIAEAKYFEGKPYFYWTFFLGIVGMLMVIALPDRNIEKWQKINEYKNSSQE